MIHPGLGRLGVIVCSVGETAPQPAGPGHRERERGSQRCTLTVTTAALSRTLNQ